MADCYHVWQFRENVKGQVGTMTIKRKCLSRNGANQNLKAVSSGGFTKIKAGMVLACMGRWLPLHHAGAGL